MAAGPVRSLCFTRPREVAIESDPLPAPGPGEVRVRTAVSAISPGTELLVYRGEAPSVPGDGDIDPISDTIEYPLRYGYSAVGTVTDLGDGVPAEWLDRTVLALNPHESHFVATPDDLLPVPDGCPPEAAAFLPSLETAVTFLLDGRPLVGEVAAVFGQGVVGLLTTALLSEYPLDALVAIEPIERRRDLSGAFGADETLAPADDVPAAVDRGSAAPGVDLAVEVSGDPAALDDAINATAYSGRVIVGSWYGTRRADIDLGGRFHRNRVRVASSQVSTIDPELRGRWDADRRRAVAWERLAAIDTDALVTHRIPIEDADTAHRLLDENPADAVGVLLTYD